MGKSFFWRLNATNALGGSSSHQRIPFLIGIQLGLSFFGKVFCQHCDRQSASIIFLTKICAILFTLLTLSRAVCRHEYLQPISLPTDCWTILSRKREWIARNGKCNIFTSSSRRLKPKLNGVGKLWSRWSILSSYLSQFAKSYQICFRYSFFRNQQIGYNRFFFIKLLALKFNISMFRIVFKPCWQ